NKANEEKSISISKAARNYHRKKKPAAKTASVAKKMKKAGRKGFFEKIVSKMSPEHIAKLKQQVIDIANKISCGKKK
ncbi:hypothetical protein NAI47_12795, partial [Francisella tularensis subsp. holarctica]|uniref:hypothetical protein n=1 Tax=Francisella tularensis TaxID=263 RepID=UPI002381AD86